MTSQEGQEKFVITVPVGQTPPKPRSSPAASNPFERRSRRMTFSQYAGFAIVPTLSRIVLCAAFITAGYGKLFTDAEFTAEEAALLKQKWGVTATLKQTAAGHSEWRHVTLASFQQSVPPPPPEDEPSDDPAEQTEEPPATEPATQPQEDPEPVAPPTTEPAAPPVVVPPTEQPPKPTVDPSRRRRTLLPPQSAPPAATEPAVADAQPPAATAGAAPTGEKYRAAKLYKMTLMLDDVGWPQPLWMSRLAAYTEFYGGILLAVGLFSRLWALGMAGVMVGAFWLTSLGVLNEKGWALFSLDIPQFNTLFVQAALFVLAFGVFLTGAGPLSVDRLLFGGGRRSSRRGVLQDEVVE